MTNTKEKQHDIRCTHCNKKLAEGVAINLSIKCPRCGKINQVENTPPK